MLDSLKEAGKSIGRELTRAWESLSDGWRELLSRCGSALVRYERPKYGNDNDSFHYWGLMQCGSGRNGFRSGCPGRDARCRKGKFFDPDCREYAFHSRRKAAGT